MTDDFKKDAKHEREKISEKATSADGVSQYLQTLEDKEGEREQLYYSQEQDFSSDDLATIINEARLNKLLAQSDAFLNSVNSEIEDFDEHDTK